MPRPLIAGNWKMNGLQSALAQIEAIATPPAGPAELLICPPATLLAAAARLSGGRLALGGQDCHPLEKGAHTGDVSAAMLKDAGASYVLAGHSERRANHYETGALVAAKAAAALHAGLTAIVCVGETLDAREAGEAEAVVAGQIADSLPADAAPENCVLAYEPVWAIGTGRTAAQADISVMHAMIRDTLIRRFGTQGGAFRVLYGGSVNPENAAAILRVPHVNGALVGGASLKAADFLAIAAACP
jgi:triosephosphate isomerase (TIM)